MGVMDDGGEIDKGREILLLLVQKDDKDECDVFLFLFLVLCSPQLGTWGLQSHR